MSCQHSLHDTLAGARWDDTCRGEGVEAVSAAAQPLVERVTGGCGAGFLTGAVDITLRGGDGFMSEKGFQLVDANACVGEVGGERVPKAVYQGAPLTLRVDPRPTKQTQHPVLHSVPGDPYAVLDADEQRSVGLLTAQSPGGGGPAPRPAWGTGFADSAR